MDRRRFLSVEIVSQNEVLGSKLTRTFVWRRAATPPAPVVVVWPVPLVRIATIPVVVPVHPVGVAVVPAVVWGPLWRTRPGATCRGVCRPRGHLFQRKERNIEGLVRAWRLSIFGAQTSKIALLSHLPLTSCNAVTVGDEEQPL